MRTVKMFIQRWKASIRTPYVWVFVVIAVLVSMIPAVSAKYHSDTAFPIGLVNEDNGPLAEDLMRYIDRYDHLLVFELNRETALRYLAMGRLEAVYVINKGFSQRVGAGEYENIVTMVTAPASSAAVLLSETVINSALMLWMVETALLKTEEFLESEGIAFTEQMRADMRLEFNDLLHNGSTISVEEHIPEPRRTGGAYQALLSSMGWYASFVVLFVITGAGWIIETRKRALGERMRAVGIRPISALSGSSSAVIAITILGWFVAGIGSAAVLSYPLILVLRVFLPMLLYMTGIMGITLAISSLLERTVQLMLIAPVFTITQGVVCGMLVEMPDWAGLLYYVSYIFPGRHFMLAADALLHGKSAVFLLELSGISALWLGIGFLAVLMKSRKAMRAAG